jgi:PAS domain-containing protein
MGQSCSSLGALQPNYAAVRRRTRHLTGVTAPLVNAGAGALARARAALAERHVMPDASYVELIDTVAAVTVGSRNAEEALLGCLRSVCSWTGWPVAHVYMAGETVDEPLRSAGIWHISEPERFAAFRGVTERTPLPRGIGLPGRVAASCRPAGVFDVPRDMNFPRRAVCAEVGLRGALAFPVQIGARCFAVVECYSLEPFRADHRLLEVAAHIGRQLGRLIHSMQTEQALRESDTRFRSVAESATDAIVAADQDGLMVSWNGGAERLAARSRC